MLRRCACGGGCPRCRAHPSASTPPALQPKLPINTPGDAWEREADLAANAAMSAAPAADRTISPSPGRALRRCACGGSCPSCAAAKAADDDELRRAHAGGGGAPGYAPPIVHDVLASSGRPLDGDTRGFMESRLGGGFGGVRVHDDAQAAASARAVDARAYAVGTHVVFGAGEYRPGTPNGDRLIAHELAHVVQQGGAAGTPAPVAPPMLSRYRNKDSVNFGKCNSATLTEKPFAKGDPWIDQISVRFTGTRIEPGGDVVPTGTLSATYDSKVPRSPISAVAIGGGYASEGLTDEGNFTVLRIEGCGYHNLNVPAKEGVPGDKRHKYYSVKNQDQASMSFAIFFRQGKRSGNQAIHKGSLGTGSLACVHLDADETLRRLNFHSRMGVTKVSVAYDPKVRIAACCARRKVKGFMVSNPCGKVKESSCPKPPPKP